MSSQQHQVRYLCFPFKKKTYSEFSPAARQNDNKRPLFHFRLLPSTENALPRSLSSFKRSTQCRATHCRSLTRRNAPGPEIARNSHCTSCRVWFSERVPTSPLP